MVPTKEHIKIGLQIVIAIMLLFFLLNSRKSKPDFSIDDKKQIIKLYDQLIAEKEKTIQVKIEENKRQSDIIASHQKKDSLILIQLLTNQPKYTSNEKKYNDIPVRVSNLTADQLKREFADY